MKPIGSSLTIIHDICATTKSNLWIYNMNGKMMFSKQNLLKTKKENNQITITKKDWETLLNNPVGITNLYLKKLKENRKNRMLQIFFFIRYNSGEPFCFCTLENNSQELFSVKNLLHDFQNRMEIPCRLKIIST